MKKFDLKNINKKSKSEQLFILLALCFVAIGIFCITGCDTKNCETASCSCNEFSGTKTKVISLPGLGGLCSPGDGCGCGLWAQSCKLIFVDFDNGEKISAFDLQYYNKSDLGCSYLDSCYIGCIEGSCENNAIFYGADNEDDMVIGCVDGSLACDNVGGKYRLGLYSIELMDAIEDTIEEMY